MTDSSRSRRREKRGRELATSHSPLLSSRLMTQRTLKIAALRTLLLLTLLATVEAARANTYYIDYAAGSNSNAGTSEGAPWKSAPGMQTAAGCAGATHSYTHAPGDKFIFKGGVTWPAVCFQITLSAGGTPSAQDYWGVCLSTDSDSPCNGGTSWPSTGWTRPFWGGSNAYTTGNHFILASGIGDFTAPTFGYITIDNIEIANYNAAPGSAGSSNVGSGPAIALGGADNFAMMPGSVVENMYIHDWVSDTPMVASNPPAVLAYGVVYGAAVMKNSTISDQGGHYYVTVSGTPHLINYPSMGGCAGCGEVKNNVVKYAWMGCSSCFSVHDNDFGNMEEDPSGMTFGNPPSGVQIHSHIIYDDGGNQQTNFVYNNAIHDSNTGLVTYFYYTTAVYNNVIWNIGNNAAIVLTNCLIQGQCAADKSSNVGYLANNTIDMASPGTALSCYRWDPNATGTGLGTLNFYNNICIPNGGSPGSFSVTTINGATTNRTMSTTEASTYGFTAVNKYSSSSADPNTAGQGNNLTTSCSGNLAPLCQDTSGAPWFGGAYKTRPTGTTAWDMGAFQGQGGATGPPSISISSPSPGTISATVNLTATCTPQGSATVSSIQFTIDGINFGAAGTSSPYTLSWNTLTAANGSHAIGAVCTDSNAQTGTAGAVSVTVSNSMPGCFVSGSNANWNSHQAFTAQTTNSPPRSPPRRTPPIKIPSSRFLSPRWAPTRKEPR